MTEQIDPTFEVKDYVTDAALPTVLSVSSTCIGPMEKAVVSQGLTDRKSFKKDASPFILRSYHLAAYATLKIPQPVFLGTGGKDHDVPPGMQLRLGADACAAGSIIEQHVYPDLDHSGTVNGSTPDSSVFVQKLFAGQPIAGNCANRPVAASPVR